MSGFAGTPHDDGTVGRGLARVVIPDATLERQLGAFKNAHGGLQVRAVKPVVDSGFGIVAVRMGAALPIPVIGIPELEEVILGCHTARHPAWRVRGRNT